VNVIKDEQRLLYLIEIFKWHNFLAFCKYYLPHLFTLPFSRHIHNDFGEIIELAAIESVFEGILAPRETAKTTFFSIAAPIFWLAKDRDEKIFLSQKTDAGVSDSMRAVAIELETNGKLIRDYGRFKPTNSRLKWSYEDGFIVDGTSDSKNLSLSGCGIRGSMIGKRSTKAIIDDPHDPDNVNTELQRDRTIQWIVEAILPTLVPKGSFIGTNSSYHEDDFLNRFKKKKIKMEYKDAAGNLIKKEFKIRTYDSIINEEKKEVIWEEKNTYEQLQFRKKIMGTEPFNRQYRNIVQSEESASFKRSDLEKQFDYNLSFSDTGIQNRSRYRVVLSAWDLAVIEDKVKAEEKDSDWYVNMVIGLTHDGNREIIGFKRFRGAASPEVLNIFESQHYKFTPDIHIVESNQFQRWFADYLLRFRNFPIYKNFTIGSDKRGLEMKSSSLHISIENHLWRFPYKTQEDREITELMCKELFYFGKMRHDDIVITLYEIEKFLGSVQQQVAESLMQQSDVEIYQPSEEERVLL